jgi:hypothetical protein
MAEAQLSGSGLANAEPQPSDSALTITEVALHYSTTTGTNRVLRMDPGHVQLIFFDDASRQTYAKGLGNSLTLPEAIMVSALVNENKSIFHDADISIQDAGFAGSVTLLVGDRWLRLSDVVRSHALVLRYQSTDAADNKVKFYELSLPLDNAEGSRKVDVVFWDMQACNAYRRGMALAGRTVNAPRLSYPNGIYKQVVEEHTRALYMPVPIEAKGLFGSVTSELCYHFENCQWTCTAK